MPRDKHKKRLEPVFWLDNKCPTCGHSAPIIYKPDLLDGPIECVCASATNLIRVRSKTVCPAEWGVAIDPEEKQHLRALLALAERQDMLWEEIARNRKKLGYKNS